MPANSRADAGHPLQWLYDRGEEAVSQVVRDLVGRRRLTHGVSNVIAQAARTKGRMDKNVEAFLHLLNLPSRADYNKLLLKIEHLQGSLVNVSMKLDRLLAAQEKANDASRRSHMADRSKRRVSRVSHTRS